MKQNVGTADKIVRIILGVALIGWGVVAGNWLGAIGIVPLATALMGFCPLYPLVGMNTCGKNAA
ncbi:MAG: DUF2892 domain-containing protein [Gammaproteobacteria bacterium HGW-Gammaproteobacteria-1]|jgi:hypothetical protein|nr:MAG: DUF2892 domain-containing protein [Gammaproteobacteria bacterium HGW-Gammaproteobacteria-1]